jgi:hypothetical protein
MKRIAGTLFVALIALGTTLPFTGCSRKEPARESTATADSLDAEVLIARRESERVDAIAASLALQYGAKTDWDADLDFLALTIKLQNAIQGDFSVLIRGYVEDVARTGDGYLIHLQDQGFYLNVILHAQEDAATEFLHADVCQGSEFAVVARISGVHHITFAAYTSLLEDLDEGEEPEITIDTSLIRVARGECLAAKHLR